MHAAVFKGVGAVTVDTVADPVIESATDALVRISAAGICGSDMWYFRGVDPLEVGSRLGHEFVGTVEDVGSAVTGLRGGEWVVAPFTYADGTCAACRRGLPTSCQNGGMWGGAPNPGGAQADAIRVPFADANLVRIPAPGTDTAEVVPYLLLADVLPTGHHAALCGAVGPDASVVIVGDGPVSLATVLAARRLGGERIAVLGHHRERLALAEALGATTTFLSSGGPAESAEWAREALGDAATTAIDCVGTQDAVDTALACVRDGGTVSWVGLPVTGATVTLLDVFDRNITIRGGIAPARAYIPRLLDEMTSGTLDPSPIVDVQLPLSQIQEAYELMDGRRAVKAVVRPGT